MNKRLWLSLLMVNVLLAMFFGFWQKKQKNVAEEHSPIVERLETLERGDTPNFTLPDLDGKDRSFFSVEGEIIVLHFWATWCAPCVIEYPSLLRLISDYKGKIKLVAVSSDEEKKDIERFLRRFGDGGENTLHLWDKDAKVSEELGTRKLPETYIFNSDFKLIRKIPNSEDWGAKGVRDFFEFLIEQTAP